MFELSSRAATYRLLKDQFFAENKSSGKFKNDADALADAKSQAVEYAKNLANFEQVGRWGKGAGAALLQDIPKMVQMTSEIVKIATRPVTVKTRLGWDDKTKKDETKQLQLILYKKFYSQQFNIPEDNIDIEFFIVKRKVWEKSPYPISRIQTFIPTSGKVKMNKATNAINLLKTDPFSRRILINSWNVEQLNQMALPPCHYSFQFYVDSVENSQNKKLRLNCLFNMRSCDVFHGLPFNIASYALLTHLIALECNMQPGILKCMLCDAHIYESHLNSINTQLERSPYMFPKIQINKLQNIFDYELSDITLIDYKYHDSINEKMVV
jgi:thymidylate synthase